MLLKTAFQPKHNLQSNLIIAVSLQTWLSNSAPLHCRIHSVFGLPLADTSKLCSQAYGQKTSYSRINQEIIS